MQRTLLLAIAFSFALGGLCQSRIAILGGIHQSTVLESNNGGNVANTGYKPRTGAHFGFVADLPFHPGSSFSFQPGVIFYNKGRKFQLSKDSALVYMNSSGGDSVVATPYFEDRRTFLNYIDIPLNLVYRFPIGKNAKLMIGAGPYLSFFYNGTDNSERVLAGVSNESEEIKDLPVGDKPGSYQVLNYGVNGLAGIEFNRVFITANYSRGLNDFYTATYPGGFKHQVIGGTLGIYLGKVTPPTPKIKDRDKDGVTDDLDACPDEAGPALTNGCPDTDGDGIADREDKCPGTPESVKVDGSGCPLPPPVIEKKEEKVVITEEDNRIVKEAIQNLEFDFAKSTIKPHSYAALDRVADLIKRKNLNLKLSGHTDNVGSKTRNLALSRERAESVKAYLVGKGVNASKIEAVGYGMSQPIASNKTAEGRQKNRRVEFTIF